MNPEELNKFHERLKNKITSIAPNEKIAKLTLKYIHNNSDRILEYFENERAYRFRRKLPGDYDKSKLPIMRKKLLKHIFHLHSSSADRIKALEPIHSLIDKSVNLILKEDDFLNTPEKHYETLIGTQQAIPNVNVEVRIRNSMVFINGERCPLSENHFEIFKMLYDAKGRKVPTEFLVRQIKEKKHKTNTRIDKMIGRIKNKYAIMRDLIANDKDGKGYYLKLQ